MGLGIIEPKGVDYVPGTAILYQTKGSAEPESPRIEDSSDSDSLRLIPVPSASPRDPLVSAYVHNYIYKYYCPIHLY